MSIIDEGILNGLQQFKIDYGGDIVASISSYLNEHPDKLSIVKDLFSAEGNPAQDPYFDVRLIGDPPKNSSSAYRYRPEGFLLKGKPLAFYIQYAQRFLGTYNEIIQDRGQNTTGYKSIRYDEKLLPYVWASILSGYSPLGLSGVNISYHLGVFSFSFRNRFGNMMSSQDFLNAILNDSLFDFVFSILGDSFRRDFIAAFADESMSFGHEYGGDFVTIGYAKQYTSKTESLTDRVLFYLEWVGKSSRSELATYFKKSDRTMNNILNSLIEQGRIRRIGKAHDPNAKYVLSDR